MLCLTTAALADGGASPLVATALAGSAVVEAVTGGPGWEGLAPLLHPGATAAPKPATPTPESSRKDEK